MIDNRRYIEHLKELIEHTKTYAGEAEGRSELRATLSAAISALQEQQDHNETERS